MEKNNVTSYRYYMIFLRYSDTALEANCYVLADSTAKEALVVDAGAGSATWVKDTLASRGLTLGAVMATHGHADHLWDAGVIAGDSVPFYIHEEDMFRLDDPLATSILADHIIEMGGGHPWIRPGRCFSLPEDLFEGDGAELVKGVRLRAHHVPGHTQGTTIFQFSGSFDRDPFTPQLPDWGFGSNFLITGDFLFRNGIGRTDLYGGNDDVMRASLHYTVDTIPNSTIFFPGHGKPSTISRELKASPYLRSYIGI